MRILRSGLLLITMAIAFMPAKGQETIHWNVIQKIRAEGFQNTEAMKIAGYLTDVYGPRLANSPSYNEAAQWVYETFNYMDYQTLPLNHMVILV